MFKSRWTPALRRTFKNKTFSSINILGLAVGMAACLLMFQYVSFELSYDRFNRNAADLYRVCDDRFQHGKLIQHGVITFSAIGKAMQEEYPEVKNYARVESYGRQVLGARGAVTGDQRVIAVDNSFLSMFSYDLLSGDRKTALSQPRTAVLTESSASGLFGRDPLSALGKVFTMGSDPEPYTVTGICKDVPENSHLQFDVLLSYSSLFTGRYPYKEADYSFTECNFWVYLQLWPGADYRNLEEKFPGFSAKYFQGDKVSGSVEKFYLQPLTDAHLHSDFEFDIAKTGSATTVWGLFIVALFTIIIAWVNYINLSTARSIERAKEVGVRKVFGATRRQLIRQFLVESVLVNLLALVLAILLVALLQPAFNRMVGRELSFSSLFQKNIGGYSLSWALLLVVLTGMFCSALYPAFILSAFPPIRVLKGRLATSPGGVMLRKALVVVQFAITITLVISAVAVYRQVRYMNTRALGMSVDNMIVIRPPQLTSMDSAFIGRENAFGRELTSIPGVLGSASSWTAMGAETGKDLDVRRADRSSMEKYVLALDGIGMGYLDLYQIKLAAGRDFINSDFNADADKQHNLLVNQSAARMLGFTSPREAIGQTLLRSGKAWTIVGVVRDYHRKSLHYAIEPELILPSYSNFNDISVKVSSQDMAATIASIKRTYDAFFPGNYFNYYFADEYYGRQYADDRLFGKTFALFSGIAIAIACLGLLGLSLYTTTQRAREIGVRKVLGASTGRIVVLLTGDFIGLVLIAIVIASPVAWLFMSRWLQGFAYHSNLSWWIFGASGAFAIIVAAATVSYQSIRAASANPVRSLRID